MGSKSREIIFTEPFEKDKERLLKKAWRLEECIRGAIEILSRDPSKGKPTKKKGVYAIPLKQLPGAPDVALYYFYSSTALIFMCLRTEGDNRPDFIIM
jgi:hypothetical protein